MMERFFDYKKKKIFLYLCMILSLIVGRAMNAEAEESPLQRFGVELRTEDLKHIYTINWWRQELASGIGNRK